MNIVQMKEQVLKLDMAEAKHYLLYLCEALEKNHIKEDDPIWVPTERVIAALDSLLNRTKDSNFNPAKELPGLIENLEKEYTALYQQTNLGNYSTHIKNAVLRVCGFLLGLCLFFPVGVATTVGCLVSVDQHNCETFGQIPRYFLTGALSAGVVSMRFCESLEDKETRQLRYSLVGLSDSFLSLKESQKEHCIEKVQQDVLTELFGNDEQAKKDFVDNEQEYRLIGFKAQFLSKNLKGYVGHHSTIVFNANYKDRIIELGTDSSVEIQTPDQDFRRKCSGKTLLNMCVMHKFLMQQYDYKLENWKRLTGYKPGDYDCHDYVNTILSSVSEPMSSVRRSLETDKPAGKLVCTALKTFGVFSEIPGLPSTQNEIAIDHSGTPKRKEPF